MQEYEEGDDIQCKSFIPLNELKNSNCRVDVDSLSEDFLASNYSLEMRGSNLHIKDKVGWYL